MRARGGRKWFPNRHRMWPGRRPPLTSQPAQAVGIDAWAGWEVTGGPWPGLIRCLFGSPFRPASIDPAWLAPLVLDLAAVAFEERILPSGELDPDRLAVLSDALEEAGCDDEDILNHLRDPGPHVRGCWAVDLVLGKE